MPETNVSEPRSFFLSLTKTRYSLRKYTDKPVEKEKLDRCLEAARMAPSACNSQPWHFIVVTSPELRTQLAEAAFNGVHKMNAFAIKAPVLIAVVREKSKYIARLGGTFQDVQYSLIDIGIAGEHLALQATEEGLGTCWLGWFNEKAVKKVLGLSRKEKIDILFSLGYPDTTDAPREKNRKPMNEFCVYR